MDFMLLNPGRVLQMTRGALFLFRPAVITLLPNNLASLIGFFLIQLAEVSGCDRLSAG